MFVVLGWCKRREQIDHHRLVELVVVGIMVMMMRIVVVGVRLMVISGDEREGPCEEGEH